MERINQLYDKFKGKFEGVNGECFRVAKSEEIGDLLINILGAKGSKTISLYESPISQSARLREKLTEAGFIVHTDDLFTNTCTDHVGITEVNWGIAELGTMVQIAPEVDKRLCSTLVPIHVALLKTDSILPEMDDVLEKLDSLPQIPGFVGFVTGPSRSSDIERILEIGVHGPEQVILIVTDQ
ncbi:MAG: LUD domain-containing protein [Peptococcaceae bacterium]|nr:LUD domain-containing protein [Peptococcaceae bacterium]